MEEHHRLDNMSSRVSGGGRRQDGGTEQHGVTTRVIPEEFLPPLLGRKEVICFLFFLNLCIIIDVLIVESVSFS